MTAKVKPSLEGVLLLLAGGNSSRMGRPKGLLELEGKPWFFHQLARFRAAGGRRAVLVLGAHAAEYFKAAPELKRAEGGSVELEGVELTVVVNSRPDLGQFSSILCGITTRGRMPKVSAGRRAARSPVFALPVFVLPVDIPAPPPSVWHDLSAALQHRDAVIPEFNGRGGHPALLSSRFCEELTRLPLEDPDARLDVQLHKRKAGMVVRLGVKEEGVLHDVNTPGDWEKWVGGGHK